MNYYYAGIGSRETPPDMLELIEWIAQDLASKGLILRSGHAVGADCAFETGCSRIMGKSEIYIPWGGFNGSTTGLIVKDEAFPIAAKFHPMWKTLKPGAKKLHARNVHQILGLDLKTPSSFVVCWTRGGAPIGGTAQALRMARHFNVPVFNLGNFNDTDTAKEEFEKFTSTVWAGN